MWELIIGIIFGISITIFVIMWMSAFEIDTERVQNKIKEKLPKEKVQFIEPVTFKQRYDKAKDIGDLIK